MRFALGRRRQRAWVEQRRQIAIEIIEVAGHRRIYAGDIIRMNDRVNTSVRRAHQRSRRYKAEQGAVHKGTHCRRMLVARQWRQCLPRSFSVTCQTVTLEIHRICRPAHVASRTHSAILYSKGYRVGWTALGSIRPGLMTVRRWVSRRRRTNRRRTGNRRKSTRVTSCDKAQRHSSAVPSLMTRDNTARSRAALAVCAAPIAATYQMIGVWPSALALASLN